MPQRSGRKSPEIQKPSNGYIPGLVNQQFANWNMAIERVVFPMKYGDFPVCYVNVYQRVECLKDDQMTFPDVMIFRIVSLRHGNAV